MSELITLSYGDIAASIDLQGAWLTRLQSAGQDVLFPRQSFMLQDGSTKLRGGSHVCFPNFGPGGASGLPQHGFARTSTWHVAEQSESTVELMLETPEGEYADVEVRLTYELLENGLSMALRLVNNGSNVVPVSPAFHPYFATTANESIVQGDSYAHVDLNEAVFLIGPVEGLDISDRRYTLRQENLPQWVLWTDGLGGYVCLEPTAVGNGFVDGTALKLAGNSSWSGSLRIDISERNES